MRSSSIFMVLAGLSLVLSASSARSESLDARFDTDVIVFEPADPKGSFSVGLPIDEEFLGTFALVLRQPTRSGKVKTTVAECAFDTRRVRFPQTSQEVEKILLSPKSSPVSVCMTFESIRPNSDRKLDPTILLPQHAYFAKTGLHAFSAASSSVFTGGKRAQMNTGGTFIVWNENQPNEFISTSSNVVTFGGAPEVYTERTAGRKVFSGNVRIPALMDKVQVVH